MGMSVMCMKVSGLQCWVNRKLIRLWWLEPSLSNTARELPHYSPEHPASTQRKTFDAGRAEQASNARMQ